MRQYFGKLVSFAAAFVIMLFIAGAGAWVANGLIIGGSALVDILPTQAIKSTVVTIFRPQTVDVASQYLLQLADSAIHLEFSTYDHLSVAYNIAVSMPDSVELIQLKQAGESIIIIGRVESRAGAEEFEAGLLRRGFILSAADYAEGSEGIYIFRFELLVAEARLSVL